MSYAPIEQIIQAIEDYNAGANGGQEPDGRDIEPAAEGSFVLSANGQYATDPGTSLLIPSSNVTLGVLGGTVTVKEGMTAVATGVTESFDFASTNKVTYVRALLTVTIALDEETLTELSVTSAVISLIETTVAHAPGQAPDKVNRDDSTLIKYFNIGTFALLRNGDRRAVRINQVLVGDVNLRPDGTIGEVLDPNGNDTRDGVRKIGFTINGKPYTGMFIVAGVEAVFPPA
jgi:hypothetical protein